MRTTEGVLHKRGRIWVATWTHDGKLYRVSTRTGDKRAAETELARLVAPFKARDQVEVLANLQAKVDVQRAEADRLDDEMNPPKPIIDLWQTYLNAQNRPDSGPATLRTYAYQVARFVGWIGKTHPSCEHLRDVTQEISAEFMTFLKQEGLSPNRHNKYVSLFRLLWRVLADEARLPGNPWEKIARRRLTTRSRRELTVEELRKVCGSATGEMRIMFAVGLFTGLRLGDCATLRWAEVDLDRGIITRVPNKTGRRNPKPVIVPLVRELRALLSEARAGTKGPYVCPDAAELYRRDTGGLCKRIREHIIASGIDTYLPDTGPASARRDKNGKAIPGTAKPAVVEVGFHSLRHSFVSLCRGANAPLAVVEAIVGHSSPAMTRHYTHVSEAAAGAAVALLPNILAAAAPPHSPPTREPLPTWARERLAAMTGKTWLKIRDEVLAQQEN